MSIALVVTEGYGLGGSIASVVLAGYALGSSSSASIPPVNRSVTFTPAANTLVTGDSYYAEITLLAGVSPLPYDFSGADVKVAVVSGDHTERWCDAEVQDIDAAGNSPAFGVLAARLSTGATLQVADHVTGAALAKLEIQVTDGNGVNTWFAVIKTVVGRI